MAIFRGSGETGTGTNLVNTALQPEDIGVTVQAYLVSTTNIKSINNISILGSGNLDVTPPDGSITTSKLGGDITAAGKALLDDANASAQRTTLGLGTAATENTTAFATAAQGALADTAQQRSYAALANGTTALALATNNVVKVAPTATATFTTTVPPAGTRCNVIIVASATPYIMTFGTGFKTTGTLTTPSNINRIAVVDFVSDGTNLLETGRTAFYAV